MRNQSLGYDDRFTSGVFVWTLATRDFLPSRIPLKTNDSFFWARADCARVKYILLSITRPFYKWNEKANRLIEPSAVRCRAKTRSCHRSRKSTLQWRPSSWTGYAQALGLVIIVVLIGGRLSRAFAADTKVELV